MKEVIISETGRIEPFGELARNLPISNESLHEHQRRALSFLKIDQELYIRTLEELRDEKGEMIVYHNNLFFKENLVKSFVESARIRNSPCQIAFSLNDSYILEHTLFLQTGIKRKEDVFIANMFYFPDGFDANIVPLVVNTQPKEVWYLSLPTKDRWLRHGLLASFDIPEQIRFAPIRLFVPLKPFMCIESWVHLLFANLLLGIYSSACNLHYLLNKNPLFRFKMLICSVIERRQPLSCSKLVKVGRHCQIDSSAIILGPTEIGDNTIVASGSVIEASIIGKGVFIGQGCHIQNSVIGNNCTLPFRTSVFMSCLMDNVILNGTLRFSIVGRNSFVGDNVCFTDRNLLGKEVFDHRLGGEMIRTTHKGKLEKTGYFLLGSAIGHNVKISAGHIIYPGRIIKSGSCLILKNETREMKIIDENIGI